MKNIVTLLFLGILGCAGNKELTPRQKAGLSVIQATDVILSVPAYAAAMTAQVEGATTIQRTEVLMSEGGEGGVVVFALRNDKKELLGTIIYFVLCNEEQGEYSCEPAMGKVNKK